MKKSAKAPRYPFSSALEERTADLESKPGWFLRVMN